MSKAGKRDLVSDVKSGAEKGISAQANKLGVDSRVNAYVNSRGGYDNVSRSEIEYLFSSDYSVVKRAALAYFDMRKSQRRQEASSGGGQRPYEDVPRPYSSSSGAGGVVSSPAGTTYTEAPNSIGIRMRTTAPRYCGEDGLLRISHTEYYRDLGTAAAAGAFEIATGGTIFINPGLPGFLPWAARLAALHEYYRIDSMSMTWEPAIGTTSAGQVMFAAVLDPEDETPATKSDFLQLMEAFSGPVWEPATLNCKFNRGWKFVRLGNLPSANSGGANSSFALADYDAGKVFVGFAGHTAAATLGSLVVSYQMSFRRPIIMTNTLIGARSFGAYCTTGVARATPFGTTRVLTGNLPVTINSTGTTLTFAVTGQHLLQFKCVGTTFADVSPTYTFTNCANVAMGGNTYAFAGANAAWVYSTTLQAQYAVMVQVNAPGATLVIDFTPSCATLTSLILNITQEYLV